MLPDDVFRSHAEIQANCTEIQQILTAVLNSFVFYNHAVVSVVK